MATSHQLSFEKAPHRILKAFLSLSLPTEPDLPCHNPIKSKKVKASTNGKPSKWIFADLFDEIGN